MPALLANVFSLCGGTHRLVARSAIDAASGHAEASKTHAAHALRFDTLREHVRRLWLDWPRGLAPPGTGSAAVAVLRDCPLLRRDAAADAIPATRAWLERHALGLPADEWLAAWQAEPADWLATWTRDVRTLPARLLADCRTTAVEMGEAPIPLRVHADAARMRDLADRLRTDAGFTRTPTIDGVPHETGPWTRLDDANVARYDNAWLRLGARLADAVRLSLDDAAGHAGASWLRFGALPLAADEGIAWCEMARGLLVHRVRLAPSGVRGDGNSDPARQSRVEEYDVLAPTEWNFHTDGVLARVLARLPADAADACIRIAATVFDPCVEVRIARDNTGSGKSG